MNNFSTPLGEFFISTDKTLLDIQFVHHYLSTESYRAKNIPLNIVAKSIDGSCCFGVYKKSKGAVAMNAAEYAVECQAGFARVVSDYATFGYLADVFIIEKFRGAGLAKWMMQTIMAQPELQGLRRWMLATRDAHGLYIPFGFLPLDKPERIMARKPFEEYPGSDSRLYP